MPELQQLDAHHAPAVLAFELANRAYFAASVTDRGDAFFERFEEGFQALLAEQAAGVSVFHVLVADDGSVLGRFNLYDIEDGTADLGYRVARHATGRGLATAAVRELCVLAATRLRLSALRAGTSRTNLASQKVLAKAGFVPAPPPPGREASLWFRRELPASPGY
jgi:[ribosomal protein S5]-alanine N-acetyltransferase